MTILVTGAAGFIGSNFVKYLNSLGEVDICISDYLTNGRQFVNLNGCKYTAFVTPDRVDLALLKHCTQVFHFGAVSNTTEWNGELVLERNYNYTVELLTKCAQLGIPASYSSSASVYGNGSGPLNLYAWSKELVDNWVKNALAGGAKIQGLRYFNVWGPGEWHKGSQASPFHQFKVQAEESGAIKIFEGSSNYLRDFVNVNRVCSIQWGLSKVQEWGIFDLGSGVQRSFTSVAEEVAASTGARIVEIPFPEHLRDCYQYNTLADMEPINSIFGKHGLPLP